MPFVSRGPDGRIVSVHEQAAVGVSEWMEPGDEHLLSFVGGSAAPAPAPSPAPALAGFNELDADFVRVIEDVIDALIARNLINLSDLPPEAQRKLMRRKGLRNPGGGASLDLFGASGDRGVI